MGVMNGIINHNRPTHHTTPRRCRPNSLHSSSHARRHYSDGQLTELLSVQLTTYESVRSTTGCLPVSERVKSFQLRFFGHLARLNPEEDHHRVIAAALRPPSDWRRPGGRPRTTWLRTIGEDLQSLTEFRGSHGQSVNNFKWP